ncbi:MAG: hypothetical protein SOX77_05925 [Candidatus Borkfalkiaceae bacterium]|nr:hypothetical protein [Christensenellaceae bacterium]
MKRSARNVIVSVILALSMCLPFMAGCKMGMVSDLNLCKVEADELNVSLETKNAQGEWKSAENTALSFTAASDSVSGWKAGSVHELPAVRIKNASETAIKYVISIKVNGDEKLTEVIDWTVNDEALTADKKVVVAGGVSDELVVKATVKSTAGSEYEKLTLKSAGIIVTVEKDETLYPSDAAALKEALAKGGNVTLYNDIEVAPGEILVVEKSAVINLNGKKIYNTNDVWDDSIDAWSLISVRGAGIELTIEGDGELKAKENDCFAVDVQDGAKVVIKGGKYIGNIHAVYVYEGAAVIEGGFYDIQQKSAQTPYGFVLNCYDANRKAGTASITVTGGTYVNFDPYDCVAEGAGTNFVSMGYSVNSEVKSDDITWYTVVKGNPKITSDVSELNGELNLIDIPVINGTDKRYDVVVTMGEVASADIAYSEHNTGYTGKGVMLGSTKLNKYGTSPAKEGEYTFIFKDGTITSAATGYESIDGYKDTSVYMLVPGNSDVLFENMTFNGVVSFDIQMYTSPWSYLNSITFKNCVFNGIIVGSCPAKKATFEGCTFNNYTNTTKANNSNPIWWRAATGYWGAGADESVHSLEEFTFINNKVTSTRPVKIERVGWNCTAKITILNNEFDISRQSDDTVTKNMAINIGQKDNTSKILLVDDGNVISENTASLYTAALGSGSNQYIEVSGSKVLDSNGKAKVITAMVWKTTTGETFEIKSID